ncbi:MAG: hypothetical protein J6A74_02395, partial [Oscillospiraceae bacterium]|nr:hypothetical protein [Oscillospiraceae bacterium]
GMDSTTSDASAVFGLSGSIINIHGGLITSEGTSEQAVYCGGTFTMDGGKIVGGMQAGNASVKASVVALGGNAVIEGTANLMNFTTATIEGNVQIENLQIPEGKKITLGELGENAKIAVTATGVFTETGVAETLQAYVTSGKILSATKPGDILVKDSALTVGLEHCINGHTIHVGETADCPEEIVNWYLWNNSTATGAAVGYADGEYKTKLAASGNWILTEDVTLSSERTTGGNLRIDLNGHTITRVATTIGARAFYVKDTNPSDNITPSLAITDLSTQGEAGSVKLQLEEGVTTVATGALVYAQHGPFTLAGRAVLDGSDLTNTESYGGACVRVNANRTFTMYGGTIKGMDSTTSDASAVFGLSGSIINIHGGLITSASPSKQAVYGGGTFTMDGGKIVGGMQAGNANVSASVVALGGNAVIEGTANFMNVTNASIEGNVQIENLQIPEGKKITLGELGDDAKLRITASGIFTTEGDAAVLQGYLDNEQIEAADSGKSVKVDGNALVVEQS